MSAPVSPPLQEDLTLLVRPAQAATDAASVAPGWIWVGLGVLLGLGAAVFFYRRRRRVGSVAPETAGLVLPSPRVVALGELARLAEACDEANARATVSAVSAVVRRFVEGRFGVPAPTLTTEELLAAWAAQGPQPGEWENFWRSFLAESDVIKYAGRAADVAQARRLAAAAAAFVRAATTGEDETRG